MSSDSSDGGDASGDDLDEMMYAISGAVGTDSDVEQGDEPMGDWNIIREYETSIEIDSVDKHLLEVARNEVPIVLNRLKVKMFGGRAKRSLHNVSPAQFLQAWMDPNLLGHVKQFINKNITGDPVSASEILAFIRVELMLSFYRVSPMLYFDIDERANVSSAGQGIDSIRYRYILKALSRPGTSRQESTSTWNPPMQHDREIAAAMDIVRTTGAEIAFVKGVTHVGLDDDLLRMRSKRVINHGFSQINNPCNGLGVIHHGAVSVVTGLYIGGHVAARGESTLDCVKILQRSMTGVSSESQIRFDGNIFFWDRGYGGINGEVNQWSVSAGATLLGTAKRMQSFPFTYDQQPGPKRQLVPERGASAQYWAKRTIKNGPTVTHQYALASRNGLGRVVLMQTTDDRYGPGKFTLVTRKRGIHCEYSPSGLDIFDKFDTENVVNLTCEQRTPEWFNQRQFRITGTSALVVWKHYAYLARAAGDEGSEMPKSLRSTCKFLG